MRDRIDRLVVSFGEVLLIGFAFGWGFWFLFGHSINTFILGMMIWVAIVGLTPLINRFFAIIPKNCGAVIVNTSRTYEIPTNENDRTRLQQTKALREVGPGLQGLFLWEMVGWTIDLGKQIQLETPIIAYSKDNIELTINWQVILTPLQGYLTFLVRHSDDTIRKFFEGKCRAKIIEIVSKEYAQSIPAQGTNRAIPSIQERIIRLKKKFNGLFGGAGTVHDDEKQYGTFTNDPQIVNIARSVGFQKSVEALQINKNNATAIKELVDEGIGLKSNQALIAVLAAQGFPTDNLIDVDLRVGGLGNLQHLNIVGGTLPGLGKRNKGNKGKGNKDE